MTDVPRGGAGGTVTPDEADEFATWDAPYVLGALGRAERLRYEAHMEQCPSCRTAVAELAVLPGLLGQVDTDVALSLVDPAPAGTAPDAGGPGVTEPPTELLPRLAARTRGRRRRGRWLAVGGAVAAAAAAVAIAIPVTAAFSERAAPVIAEHVVAERQLDPVASTPITASVRLVAVGDGTRVEMSCTYAPSDTDYTWQGALWVIHNDGTQSKLAQWTVHPGQTVTPDGTTAVPPDQIRTVQLRSEQTGQVVLSSTL
ncbi:hypothetical protein ABIA39_002687 [Nocardia sp. GAS34]|uniref:anti-sigma factor family protein n=1 Tax=unclassified Nocardia TaxID=2637762 RepID=UPI003D240A7A